MIEITFTGSADVIRKEMLILLGAQPISDAQMAQKVVQIAEQATRIAAASGQPAVIDDMAALVEARAAQEPADVAEPKPETEQPAKAARGRGRPPKTEAPATDAPLASSAPEPTAPSADASAAPKQEPPAASPEPAAPTAAPATEITWDEVRAKIEAFGKAKGPKPLIDFVRSWGVQRASQIPKEQYGEVLAKLTVEMAA